MTEINEEKSKKALQLSVLAYEEKELIAKWVAGDDVDMTGSKVWFDSCLKQTDMKGIRAVYFGEDPVGGFHKAQWLAGECDGVLYIAFKGTDNATDFLLDTSLSDVLTPSGCRVHCGFYSGIQQELPIILDLCNAHKCNNIVFCGHSLGGAYATLSCLELTASLRWERGSITEAITFGAPLTICGGSEDGPPVLPSKISLNPPKMTHFVANFDVVPRLLAFNRKAAISFLEEIPMLIASGPLSTVVSLAQKAGYAKADALINATQHLRSCFRCVGTYVMCTSVVVGKRRTASFTVVPPSSGAWNQTAQEHLKFFPPFESSATSFTEGASSAARQDFVKQAINDHYLAGSYWVILDQLQNSTKMTNSGLTKRVADPASGVVNGLVTFDPMASMGLVEPNEVILANMSEHDQKAWGQLVEDLKRLSKSAMHARDQALAKHTVDTPLHEQVPPKLVCPVASAVVGNIGSESPAPSPSEKNKKKTPITIYVVNMVQNNGVAVTLPGNSGWSETIAYKTGCQVATFPGEALSITTNTPLSPEIVVKFPHDSKNDRKCIVIESSGGVGDVVWETKVKEVKKDGGSWFRNPWEKKKKYEDDEKEFETEKVSVLHPAGDCRTAHLHNYSKYLELNDVTFAAVDASPRGVGCAECDWTKGDKCTGCSAVFSKLGKLSRHHCRECGTSVCHDCSPSTYYNSLSPQSPVRICKGCQKRLFRHIEETTNARTAKPVEKAADHLIQKQQQVQPQW
eukprot:TRINITY_DN4956_c0_g2_i1.p1 TRINITY_DN4956_c0_g2~~TRINITY_DN4956_c0_g2_i1.p1  ORF type:complete len:742 (+),score=168.56 TRINITY_DN4956_c0_g2_i1:70-2295(+)